MGPNKRRVIFGKARRKPAALNWRIILILAVSYIFFAAVVISAVFPPGYNVSLGATAPQRIVAHRSVVYIDKEKTKELQDLAEQAVMPVYNKDFTPARQNLVKTQINNYFNIIEQIATNESLPWEEKFNRLRDVLPETFDEESIESALSLDPALFTTCLSYTIDIAMQFLGAGIKEEDMPQLPLRLEEKMQALGLPPEAKTVMVAISRAVLTPNLTLDVEETAYRRQVARNAVEPVRRTVSKGEVVVEKGEIITPEKLAILEALGVYRESFPWLQTTGIILISLLLYALWVISSAILRPDFLTLKHLIFVFILLAILLLTSRFLPNEFSFLIPLPLLAMLLAAYLGFPLTLAFLIFSFVAVGLIQGNDFLFSLILFLGSAYGAYFSRQILKAGDILTAGLLSGIFLSLACGTVGLYTAKDYLPLLEEMGLSFLNGSVSGILALFILLLRYLEKLDLTSPLRLLEIANPNHPLLKRLQLEAPGTYHHSIIVASLAESGASAIGADALLARAAGYFHDIGKMIRPQYFAENQTDENVHEKISPQLSAQVICAHAKDGVELAKRYSLPPKVQEIIASHHGTTLASYFYWQAMKSSEENAQEEVFRYPGPKPRSKEGALTMLADSVEAAVRSLKEKTPEHIANMVEKIIQDRVNDGQLADSELSFWELSRIKEAFIRVLSAAYHLRPEYPEEMKKGARADADQNKQSAPPHQAA